MRIIIAWLYSIEQSRVRQVERLIPVGWYPDAVKVIGKKIWVANGKDFLRGQPVRPNR